MRKQLSQRSKGWILVGRKPHGTPRNAIANATFIAWGTTRNAMPEHWSVSSQWRMVEWMFLWMEILAELSTPAWVKDARKRRSRRPLSWNGSPAAVSCSELPPCLICDHMIMVRKEWININKMNQNQNNICRYDFLMDIIQNFPVFFSERFRKILNDLILVPETKPRLRVVIPLPPQTSTSLQVFLCFFGQLVT